MFRRWHNAPDPEENDAMHQEAKVNSKVVDALVFYFAQLNFMD